MLEMTPGHDVERDGHGEGSTGGWGDRQGLVHGLAAAPGAPNEAHTPASQFCPSRLSQDSSLAASAAATPTHLRHSDDGAADAHVTIFRPSLDASREHSPLTNGSAEQVRAILRPRIWDWRTSKFWGSWVVWSTEQLLACNKTFRSSLVAAHRQCLSGWLYRWVIMPRMKQLPPSWKITAWKGPR